MGWEPKPINFRRGSLWNDESVVVPVSSNSLLWVFFLLVFPFPFLSNSFRNSWFVYTFLFRFADESGHTNPTDPSEQAVKAKGKKKITPRKRMRSRVALPRILTRLLRRGQPLSGEFPSICCLVRYLRSTLGNWPSWSSDYSCNLSHIGEKCTALDQTRNFIREEIS